MKKTFLIAGRIRAAAALVLAVSLSACERQPEAATDALAVVDGTPITAVDLQDEADRRARQGRGTADKETLLEEIVTRRAIVAKARQSGLTDNPDVRREIDNLIIAKVREHEIENALRDMEITDEEIRTRYEADLAAHSEPAKARLALLFRALSPGASEGKRQETVAALEAAREEILRNPAPGGRGPAANGFGTLAIEESEDQASRYRGGDIGWLDAGRDGYPWPEPVLSAGFALPVGEVSPVIISGDGAYVVMKTDARDGSSRPFGEVAGTIRNTLREERRRTLESGFTRSARDSAAIRIHHENLAAFELRPAPARAAADDAAIPGFPANNP